MMNKRRKEDRKVKGKEQEGYGWMDE